MFFDKFTQSNLQVLSFNTIKHEIHRLYAIDVLTLGTKMNVFSKLLLTENTIRKNVFLQKTDKVGVEIKLLLCKPSGYIQIHIKKKRKGDINVYFIENDFNRITERYYYKSDCEDIWVKQLLFEFDSIVISYIRNGFSNKLKNIQEFVRQYFIHGNVKIEMSVYIDIPGFLCII